MKNQQGLYIHIPVCSSKCLYCDFYSTASRNPDFEKLVNSLLNEIKHRFSEFIGSPTTVYIGGGTPSLLPQNDIESLIRSIKTLFKGNFNPTEFTIEVNPDDVNEDKVLVWKNLGINRISMGVQSFEDNELTILNRRHNSETAIKAYNILRRHFSNISIDLIFGLPGQTLTTWMKTLEKAIKLNPEHISVYSLTVEEKTLLSYKLEKGELTLPTENEVIQMWKKMIRKLTQEGYLNYEISNFAKKGFESKHNSSYWHSVPYIGIGPSAHSFDGKLTRCFNPSNLKNYIEFFNDYKLLKINSTDFYDKELLTDVEVKEEWIMTRLRLKSGLNKIEAKEKFGEEFINTINKPIQKMVIENLLKDENENISLTEKGLFVMDNIILRICSVI